MREKSGTVSQARKCKTYFGKGWLALDIQGTGYDSQRNLYTLQETFKLGRDTPLNKRGIDRKQRKLVTKIETIKKAQAFRIQIDSSDVKLNLRVKIRENY